MNKVECSADLSFLCIHRAKQHSASIYKSRDSRRTQNNLLCWPKCTYLSPFFGNANNDIYIAKSVSEFINIQLLFRVDSSNTGWRSEYDYLII